MSCWSKNTYYFFSKSLAAWHPSKLGGNGAVLTPVEISAALRCPWRGPALQETHAASQALWVTHAPQNPCSTEQSGEAQFPWGRWITASQISAVAWATEQPLSFHGSLAILSRLITGPGPEGLQGPLQPPSLLCGMWYSSEAASLE